MDNKIGGTDSFFAVLARFFSPHVSLTLTKREVPGSTAKCFDLHAKIPVEIRTVKTFVRKRHKVVFRQGALYPLLSTDFVLPKCDPYAIPFGSPYPTASAICTIERWTLFWSITASGGFGDEEAIRAFGKIILRDGDHLTPEKHNPATLLNRLKTNCEVTRIWAKIPPPDFSRFVNRDMPTLVREGFTGEYIPCCRVAIEGENRGH